MKKVLFSYCQRSTYWSSVNPTNCAHTQKENMSFTFGYSCQSIKSERHSNFRDENTIVQSTEAMLRPEFFFCSSNLEALGTSTLLQASTSFSS